MKHLSQDLEVAIANSIEVLGFVVDIDKVNSEKLEALMKSKADSFLYTKQLILDWENSINAPNDTKLYKYIKDLVKAGESSILDLRQALRKKIDTDLVDVDKIGASIKAKQIIYRAITELDSGLIQLKMQLASNSIDLKQREFKVGYPERFANQEFFPKKDYYKEWYDEKTDSIILDPKGTIGEIIVLDNLRLALPEVPKDKSKILFSDLPKEEQYWRRIEPPKGLIPETEDAWAEYIIEEFRRRREGVFFMNNGKVEWLTGTHYMGLQWNTMLDSGSFKEFRLAQRDMYYFCLAVIIDPRCVGILFCKGRRTGFTEVIIDHFEDFSTSTKNALFGITSKTGSDASEAFLKYSYGVQNLPFFFIPVVKGKIDDRNKMEYGKVSDSSKVAKKKKDTSTDDYLNTKVDWMNTTTLSYDSKKLFMYLGDEAGKWERPNNYEDHWANIKPTLVTGGKVVGTAFIGSTVGAVDKGGKEFKNLYAGSNVLKRNDNGRTTTGLYSFFLPAHRNYEDYTDRYGVCHITVPQGEHFYNTQGIKMTIGSLQYLENEFRSAKQMGGKHHNNVRRLDPITIDDAFRDESKGSLFDLDKLNDQMSYNNRIEIGKTLARGNFQWKDGIRYGESIWCPSEKGRFLLAWIPEKDLQNRWIMKNNLFGGRSRAPLNDEIGCLGIDSYDISAVQDSTLIQTENGREYDLGSKGAISGVTGFQMGNIPSNFFFLEYIARPETAEIFFEDALLSAVFYGMPILAESNKARLLYHFMNSGYRNFSLTRFDKPSNRLSPTEKQIGGLPSNSADVLAMHYSAIEAYVEKHVGIYSKGDDLIAVREEGEIGSMPFNRHLADWAQFNILDRTKYDISIASGLALMGVQRKSYKMEMPQNKPLEFAVRTYGR